MRIADAIATHTANQKEYESRFGKLRPVIHTEFAGRKVVAVGQTVYYSDRWKTFPDFLSWYIKSKVPKDWYKAEYARAPADRHPLVQWYVDLCAFQSRHRTPDAHGLYSGEPDGPSLAFLVLAHELFILEGDLLLQKKLIQRLLHRDQFQGARYEITVAAAMIRAGFSIELEDEGDSSKPHPEFMPTHRATNTRVAVETKSRHRDGVLGRTGELKNGENLAADVRGLFAKALKKASDYPLIVFIDANLPASLELGSRRTRTP